MELYEYLCIVSDSVTVIPLAVEADIQYLDQ